MTRPPSENAPWAPYLRMRAQASPPAHQPTSLPAVLCVHRLVCFLCWLGASIQPSNSSTRHETRLIPSTTGPMLPSIRAPQGQAAAVLPAAPPSDDLLALGWSHTSNGSLNYTVLHASRNTTACFRSLRPAPSAKGDARTPAQSWSRPHYKSAPRQPSK